MGLFLVNVSKVMGRIYDLSADWVLVTGWATEEPHIELRCKFPNVWVTQANARTKMASAVWRFSRVIGKSGSSTSFRHVKLPFITKNNLHRSCPNNGTLFCDSVLNFSVNGLKLLVLDLSLQCACFRILFILDKLLGKQLNSSYDWLKLDRISKIILPDG